MHCVRKVMENPNIFLTVILNGYAVKFPPTLFIFCMVCKMGIAIICLPVFKRWAIIDINSCRMAHQWTGLLTRKTIRKGFFTSLVEMLVRTGLLCSRWLVVSVSTVALPYSLGNEILYIFKRGRTIFAHLPTQTIKKYFVVV